VSTSRIQLQDNSPSRILSQSAAGSIQFGPGSGHDKPYLMSVKRTAEYIGRTEKAVRHLYEKGIFTPLRIDGRVFIDRREVDEKFERARADAY
jgi:hypothetical protein